MAYTGNAGRLTPRQRRAINALLTARDQREAAALAGVGYRSLMRWMAEDPAFRQALVDAQADLLDETARRLLAGNKKALDALDDLLSTAESESVRRGAARDWFELLLKVRDRDLEKRVAALEDKIHGKID